MLAGRPSQTIGIKYYLLREGDLFRLPTKLHHQLLDREVAVPKLANSDQKIIEVLYSTVVTNMQKVTARGSILQFDKQGYVDLRPMRDAATKDWGRLKQHPPDIVDFQSRRRLKHFKDQYTWSVPAIIFERVKGDLMRRSEADKIPLLRLSKLT